MQRTGGSRFLPFLITVIIIVLVVMAVISIGRLIFSDKSKDTKQTVDPGISALTNVNAKNSVRMTMRGPIVAEEKFQSFTLTVGTTKRELVVYDGYLETLNKRKVLDNNIRAYEQLVFALDKANMMVGIQPDDKKANDLRGICASGYVYVYEVLENDEPVKKLWTSSCKGSIGTLKASTDQLNNLFFNQIPGSRKLVPFTGPSSSLTL